MNYFLQKDFKLIDPPIIHEYIPNKKSEVYISIEDETFSLNSSNALYMSAYAVLMEKVFSISPTFRIERPSDNHLVEFKMLEVELLDCSFDRCMELVFDFIKSMLLNLCNMQKGTVFKERFKELYNSFQIDSNSYIDIINKLKSKGCAIEYGADLSDYDNEVSKIISNPTFVIDYPFPMASWTALPKDYHIAYAFNLILPDQYGELAEGCQRNNDYKLFMHKFEQADIHVLDWYADAIKSCKTDRSGFGLGMERLIRWATGSKKITDTVLFPRCTEER
jgi:asparaginyl-tRNA synthetase